MKNTENERNTIQNILKEVKVVISVGTSCEITIVKALCWELTTVVINTRENDIEEIN